jgi:hypothetical protein
MPGDTATNVQQTGETGGGFTGRVFELLTGIGLVTASVVAAPLVGTGLLLSGVGLLGLAGIGLALDGGLNKARDDEKAKAAATFRDDGTKMIAKLDQLKGIDPALLTPAKQLNAELQKAASATPLTDEAMTTAIDCYKKLFDETDRVLHQEDGLRRQRETLRQKYEAIDNSKLPADSDWGKAVLARIGKTGTAIEKAVGDPLSVESIRQLAGLVNAVETQSEPVTRCADVWTDLVALRKKLDVDAFAISVTKAEERQIKDQDKRVIGNLTECTARSSYKARTDLETLAKTISNIDEDILAFGETRQECIDEWEEASKAFDTLLASKTKTLGTAAARFKGGKTDIERGFLQTAKLGRPDCDLTALSDLIESLNKLHTQLNNPTAIPVPVAVDGIGLSSDGSDMDKLYGYYTSIGGRGGRENLKGVCDNAKKAGGHYTCNGVKYRMWHDSHGPTGASSANSVTAWKIRVDGENRIVGVGYHDPDNGYQCIFPFALDGRQRKRGAQVEIVDKNG